MSADAAMRRTVQAIAVALAILSIATPAFSQWQETNSDARIPMRDGQHLAADIYLPPAAGEYPTILIQTPYNRTNFRVAARWNGRGIIDRDRYAYVVLDWRGYFGSKPARTRRPNRGQDGYDAVEWIAAQEWSDGKVGTWGASALGKVQFMTAKEQPPHLACCVPIVAAEGQAYEDFFMDGVYRKAHLESLVRVGFGGFSALSQIRQSTALLRLLANSFDQVASVNVPILMITGWYDHAAARQLDTFEALHDSSGPVTQENANILIGPWHHSAIGKSVQGALEYPSAEGESDRAALAFFDYWMRGEKDNGWADQPKFRGWQINEGAWIDSANLGGPDTTERVIALDGPARTIISDPAKPVPTIGGANLDRRSGSQLLAGPHDQSELEARDDVAVYSIDPGDEPLRIHGSVRVELTFETTQRDATFAARMCDVHPDGRSMLIVDGVTRAKYREGPGAALAVQPGQTYTATITLPPAAITIGDGHQLRVLIAGSNYPRFELNPHTGDDRFDPDTAVAATYTIHSGKLIVPVLD